MRLSSCFEAEHLLGKLYRSGKAGCDARPGEATIIQIQPVVTEVPLGTFCRNALRFREERLGWQCELTGSDMHAFQQEAILRGQLKFPGYSGLVGKVRS